MIERAGDGAPTTAPARSPITTDELADALRGFEASPVGEWVKATGALAAWLTRVVVGGK